MAEDKATAERLATKQKYLSNKQKYFQSIHTLTHLKGPYDRVTSVVIPSILLLTAGTLMGRGIYQLATGTGIKE